jgi:hypothetical protein
MNYQELLTILKNLTPQALTLPVSIYNEDTDEELKILGTATCKSPDESTTCLFQIMVGNPDA